MQGVVRAFLSWFSLWIWKWGVQGSMRLELGRKLGLGVFSVSIRMVGARVVSFS